MNTAAFVIIAVLTLAGALAAAALSKLIHAALSLVLAFIGVAAFYFLLGAEFVGLVQVLVYVGAVAVLIVFTILLTQKREESAGPVNWGGIAVALLVFAGIFWAIINTSSLNVAAPAMEPLTVQHVGEVLMKDYVWPLQCIGVLLTAALIGAVVMVLEEKK